MYKKNATCQQISQMVFPHERWLKSFSPSPLGFRLSTPSTTSTIGKKVWQTHTLCTFCFHCFLCNPKYIYWELLIQRPTSFVQDHQPIRDLELHQIDVPCIITRILTQYILKHQRDLGQFTCKSCTLGSGEHDVSLCHITPYQYTIHYCGLITLNLVQMNQ